MPQVLLVDGSEKESPAERALRAAAGFEVRGARRAETVFEMEGVVSENGQPRPGVLVSSWFLPRLNGPALAETLREAGADLPILLLTGRSGAEARAEALRRGADDCLTRPADPRELIARLEALCRRPDSWERAFRKQVGPLQVDAPRMEARAYGSALDLRKKEFFLLYLLADRRPAVVSREMIACRAWGRGHVSDNSIDVTVSALRGKLKAALAEETLPEGATSEESSADGRPQIETVRGVGYRLVLGAMGEA